MTFVPFARRRYEILEVDVTGKLPRAAVESALPADTEQHLYRILLTGETDENGWSRLVRVAKGEPFAVVATSADGTDSTFLALRDSMEVDETYSDGCRPEYLADDGVEAFLWTDRGIYRHDEKIMVHALLRNGRRQAPSPMPVELRLVSPKGDKLPNKFMIYLKNFLSRLLY